MVQNTAFGDRSDTRSTVFQRDGRRRGAEKPLYPGQSADFKIGYQVTSTTYRTHREFFNDPVCARALVDGRVVSEIQRTFAEMQEF